MQAEDRIISVMMLMLQFYQKKIFGNGCPFLGFEHLPPIMSVHVSVLVDPGKEIFGTIGRIACHA